MSDDHKRQTIHENTYCSRAIKFAKWVLFAGDFSCPIQEQDVINSRDVETSVELGMNHESMASIERNDKRKQ